MTPSNTFATSEQKIFNCQPQDRIKLQIWIEKRHYNELMVMRMKGILISFAFFVFFFSATNAQIMLSVEQDMIKCGGKGHLVPNTFWFCREVLEYEGIWGEWGQIQYDLDPFLLGTAIMFRSEDRQGFGDDTAGNGIKVWLNSSDSDKTLTSPGVWGDWKQKVECPEGGWYINGFQVQFEDPQGRGDDTAMNGLRVSCKQLFSNSNEGEISLQVYKGLWGEWKDWVKSDKNFLCGIQTRFEDCEERCDDTGLNGIRFYMCDASWDP